MLGNETVETSKILIKRDHEAKAAHASNIFSQPILKKPSTSSME